MKILTKLSPLADPRGPLGTSQFSVFNFIQFWERIAKIIGWDPNPPPPTTWILDPPLIYVSRNASCEDITMTAIEIARA